MVSYNNFRENNLSQEEKRQKNKYRKLQPVPTKRAAKNGPKEKLKTEPTWQYFLTTLYIKDWLKKLPK